MVLIKRRSHAYIIIFIALIILQCEGRERFYRPDLPEQLCAIGLIDIDDTVSYGICSDPYHPEWCHTCSVDTVVSTKKVFFEKSYQTDYSDGSTDLFRDFEFNISDGKEVIFTYKKNEPTGNPFIKTPADLKFEPGKKYYFQASEKDAGYISAECTVPDLPPEPRLVSLKTGINILDLPKDDGRYFRCYYWGDILNCKPIRDDTTTYTRRFAEIEFSFSNTNPESYYTLFLIATPPGYFLEEGKGWKKSNFLNYEVLETNTIGFSHKYKGGVTIQHFCYRHGENLGNVTYGCMTDTLYSYFIDGSKIPGGTCTMKILAQWDNVKYIPSFVDYFRIRIMSLPKEAYLFYKSLYTYKMERDDPFGELININGNVVGGNGIIALCRSRDLIVNINQTGKMYDPFF
jgi:hypothetical protein